MTHSFAVKWGKITDDPHHDEDGPSLFALILQRYCLRRFPRKSDFLQTPSLTECTETYTLENDYGEPCTQSFLIHSQPNAEGTGRHGTLLGNQTTVNRPFRIYWESVWGTAD